jgi:glycosyltransferase involved in cell wall biosynthesis
VQALAGPRVEVCGWVDDLAPVFARARLAVSPLRYGAGLKLKNVAAMAHGLPAVTTDIGAEGMTAGGGSHLLHSDEPEDLARHVLELLRDDALWEKVSAAALAFVRDQYAPAVIEPRLQALLPAGTTTRREMRHTRASERLRSPSGPG